MYRESLKVVQHLLQRVQSEFHQSLDDTKRKTPPAAGILADLGSGIGGLLQVITRTALPPASPDPSSDEILQEGWLNLVVDELFRFNQHGLGVLCSCSEALLKAHGIMNRWHAAPGQRQPIFYRGEHVWGWELKPRVGRAIPHDRKNPLQVSSTELALLANFQGRVTSDPTLRAEICGPGSPPDAQDPKWWSLMQHYDAEAGTRLVDITSSIFCGLYFACADWEGSVDTEKDGCLYLFPSTMGRNASERPEIIRGRNVGSTDQSPTSAGDYFSVENHPDTVRFRVAPGSNERLAAQDGYFFWQPRFDQPLALGQHFRFRVHRGAKDSILRELYSIGYTPSRMVRGAKGVAAERKLADRLGLLRWRSNS